MHVNFVLVESCRTIHNPHGLVEIDFRIPRNVPLRKATHLTVCFDNSTLFSHYNQYSLLSEYIQPSDLKHSTQSPLKLNFIQMKRMILSDRSEIQHKHTHNTSYKQSSNWSRANKRNCIDGVGSEVNPLDECVACLLSLIMALMSQF